MLIYACSFGLLIYGSRRFVVANTFRCGAGYRKAQSGDN
ncbi:hypothetical protein BQ8794_80081 [Mesorhizobium prunaredense]|uniref:Uncharacterized protein n=1 Tax=Mesorhizobium prunaredense TaxID=1631249 RepID=A0A1R3VIK8_9HYPH|nr:hypothetical protein BQ8794_80081 [Mesorhizobium prunaredense]